MVEKSQVLFRVFTFIIHDWTVPTLSFGIKSGNKKTQDLMQHVGVLVPVSRGRLSVSKAKFCCFTCLYFCQCLQLSQVWPLLPSSPSNIWRLWRWIYQRHPVSGLILPWLPLQGSLPAPFTPTVQPLSLRLHPEIFLPAFALTTNCPGFFYSISSRSWLMPFNKCWPALILICEPVPSHNLFFSAW